MSGRSARIFASSLILAALTIPAFGQNAVKLEHKFTRGELLRYKMIVDMTVKMGMPGMPEMPPIPGKTVMVMRQRVKQVLPNGDAEVAIAFESLRVDIGGNSHNVPVDKIPVTTMVMSPIGAVKSVKGLEKVEGLPGGMPLMNMENLPHTSPTLPLTEVSAGDTWIQEIPFPLGGKFQALSKLLSTNAQMGKYNVAVIKQDVGGDFDLDMPIPMPGSDNSSGAPNIKAKGKLLGFGTIYFAHKEGRIIRSEMTLSADVSADLPASVDGPAKSVTANLQMTMQMFLLPPKSGK